MSTVIIFIEEFLDKFGTKYVIYNILVYYRKSIKQNQLI